jgi:hypothetical protein
MKKELKQVSEGQGFVCANLEEKKRIWQKLTDAGYPMVSEFELSNKSYLCIEYINGRFMGSTLITDPLNESEFFDDWTPQAGEWVDTRIKDHHDVRLRQFCFEKDGLYYVVLDGYELPKDTRQSVSLGCYDKIRQIKPETMTLQEVREALGKPNLIIE